jgi:hypothetical protein
MIFWGNNTKNPRIQQIIWTHLIKNIIGLNKFLVLIIKKMFFILNSFLVLIIKMFFSPYNLE